MAALTPTAPFQNALKPCCRRAAGVHRRALVVKAQKGEADWQTRFGVHLLAAGLAAATVLGQPSIAEAGVVMEQPKVKKLFQGANKPQQPAETQSSSGEGGGLSLPSVSLPSVGLPSLPEFSGLNVTPSDALDVRTVALPASVLGIAALGYVSYKYDAGFRSMIREGMVKDSNGYAGYEVAVDEYADQAKGQISKGTKKISKAVKAATPNKAGKKGAKKAKGGFFGLGKK